MLKVHPTGMVLSSSVDFNVDTEIMSRFEESLGYDYIVLDPQPRLILSTTGLLLNGGMSRRLYHPFSIKKISTRNLENIFDNIFPMRLNLMARVKDKSTTFNYREVSIIRAINELVNIPSPPTHYIFAGPAGLPEYILCYECIYGTPGIFFNLGISILTSEFYISLETPLATYRALAVDFLSDIASRADTFYRLLNLGCDETIYNNLYAYFTRALYPVTIIRKFNIIHLSCESDVADVDPNITGNEGDTFPYHTDEDYDL